ncbi:MAG: glycosyltransferase 87 family protein [Actinobacteria bacterium]|nr:glycosyltransferase 87 family protein [Actinomycetota bacterium]
MTSQLLANTPTAFRRAWLNPITLWIVFVVVHVWVSALGLYGPGYPLGDISGVYTFWAGHAYAGDFIVGITTPWVYPIVALVPILVAGVAGMENYVVVFLAIVAIVDAVVFGLLIRRVKNQKMDAARAVAAWWWLALLVCLGPVSLGRIDAISTPIALLGLLYLLKFPRTAGALLAVAAWVKVWPAAIVGAALIALSSRRAVLNGALITSGAVVAIALVMGSGLNVASFITQQTSRGLQIESPAATAYLWQVNLGAPNVGVYYDEQILTYQVSAPGVEIIGSLTTVLMALFMLLIVVVGILAIRRGANQQDVLFALALAFTVELIAFNKVGSPQFMGWLAVPIVAGLVYRPDRFRVPAVIALIMAGLTQMLYPYSYDNLLRTQTLELTIITIRNVLEFVLLGLAIRMLLGSLKQSTNVTADKL